MTIRQSFLKLVYPVFMRLTKGFTSRNKIVLNELKAKPKHSIYDLTVTLNSGEMFSLHSLKGKNFLIVNTASNCGYTEQYASLQKVFEKEGLMIIGFPANDFKEQEKGSDEEIASFCKINYGIRFPITKKTTVIPSPQQHEVFKWLCTPELNGWNKYYPSWNFCKYLIDGEGKLKGYFASAVEPEEVLKHLNH